MIYSHYSALMAEAMDRARPGPDAGQLDFLVKYLRKDAANLELACGNGRLLYPIAQLGYEIQGIDASPEMLERSRLKEPQYGFKVPTSIGFMQNFTSSKKFGLIFIADCSFDLLYTDEDQKLALENIRKHLLPGGTLLFDTETPPDPQWMASGQSSGWSSYDDGKTIIVSRKIFQYDRKTFQRPGLQIHELYIDGQLKSQQAYDDPMRFNDPETVVQLLQDTGFKDIKLGRYQSDDPPLGEVGELVSIWCHI